MSSDDFVSRTSCGPYTLTVEYAVGESPREWDNLGTLYCASSKYDIGDEHYESPGTGDSTDYLAHCLYAHLYPGQLPATHVEDGVLNERGVRSVLRWAEKRAVWRPVYLFDHSGVAVSTTPFSCKWDSGLVGYLIASRERVLECYRASRMTAAVRARAEAALEAEVETLNKYVSGEVYRYTVTGPDGEVLDSCSGFYDLEQATEDAEDFLSTLTGAEQTQTKNNTINT